jgi:hypothetical protein
MKRKHSEMIKAWADSDDTVALAKTPDDGWIEVIYPLWVRGDHFVCLTKHEEAVLALLNGGTAQFKSSRGWPDSEVDYLGAWSANGWYMSSEVESCVRPKKQTRYAYLYPNGEVSRSYLSSWELHDHYLGCRGKMITFEVEV